MGGYRYARRRNVAVASQDLAFVSVPLSLLSDHRQEED
jgi:hypothetical protein